MYEIQNQLNRIEAALVSQKSILTMAELSQYTGLSKSCLYKLTSARKIPFSCPNKKTLFFEKAAIDKWLLSNPVRTAEEIDIAAANYVVLNPNRRRQA